MSSEVRRRKRNLSENIKDHDEELDKRETDTNKSEEVKIVPNKINIEPGSYWLTRILFLRYLAFIYFIAFSVSLHQNKELIGNNGLTPARLYLNSVGQRVDTMWDRMLHVPTVLWFVEESGGPDWQNMDIMLDSLAMSGLVLSSLVLVTGAANMVVMTGLWVTYFSLVSVGQTWFSFGWESQLLETGFLAIWSVPFMSWSKLPSSLHSPSLCVWGYRWLIFRIMLGAGLIKVRGDQCWRDLTCMNYFYQTQPNPNPLAYFAHQAPGGWHSFETFGNHVIELALPFLSFVPHRMAWIGNGIFQIFFQIVLITTGNLSFLNWLTVAPSIWYFDDRFLSYFFSSKLVKKVSELQVEDKELAKHKKTRTSVLQRMTSWCVGCLLVYLSVPIVINLTSPHQAMNRSFDPLRLVNTYGAFGSVTKERTEVVLEGTHSMDPYNPEAVWQEYHFKCKPGDPYQQPCTISPYHYRLDWLMWFAAFQQYQQNPWLLHLMGFMMENNPLVDSLLSKNPFKDDKPPVFVRARHFKYEFTQLGSKRASAGKWWNRKLIGDYIPPVDMATLKPIYKQFGWPYKQE